jgi:hypothetical protein
MDDKKINVKLLRQIKRRILEEPRHFDMAFFAIRPGKIGLKGDLMPPCNTVACIAGDAVILSDGPPKRITEDFIYSVEDRATELLGLNYSQAQRLFFLSHWPADFADGYIDADETAEDEDSLEDERLEAMKTRARIAADRIDYFIRTNGEG